MATYPITSATQAQLNQLAANIAQNVFSQIQQGQYEDVYTAIANLAQAVNCLVQYNANNTSTTLSPSTKYQTAVTLTNTTIATRAQ